MKYSHEALVTCHSFLMNNGFPYHSVSVIHRHQDLGYHVIFTSDVKDKITDKIKSGLKNLEFTYSIVNSNK